MQTDEGHRKEIAELLAKIATTKPDKEQMKNLVGGLRRGLKVNHKGVSVSGQGVAELLVNVAQHIPVRDFDTLSAAHGGTTGTTLAGLVIRNATRTTAGVGAATGALASANQLAPPLWVMLPAELVAETLVIAAIEIRMVGELHAVYGQPIEGDKRERGLALLAAWAGRRGVGVDELKDGKKLSQALGKGTGNQIVALVKRKLMARLFRNVSSFAPLFVGAVAGAELNRRSTRALGNELVMDLARPKTR